MGLLHASYGIGATLGPLAVTIGLARLDSWRPAFVLFAVIQAVVAFGFITGRRDWSTQVEIVEDDGPAPVVSIRARNLAVSMFALLAAVETAGAQWGFSLLTVERGLSDTAAGLAVTGYYAALTGARLLLGVIGHRIDPVAMVRGGTFVALAGASLVWWAPAAWAGAVGLVVLGMGIGPLFPLGMSLTPQRVGAAATPKVVGYQLVAANVGAAAYPAAIGLAVDRIGLVSVGPAVVIAAVALVLVSEALRRLPATEPPRRATVG
jgi:fucose permease